MRRHSTRLPLAWFFALILIVSMTGCYGGSRARMRFDDLKYPVSLSPSLYGPQNKILQEQRGLIVLERFRVEVTIAAIFYSLVPTSRAIEVSTAINSEIEKRGGDGAVNVRINAKPGITTYLHPLTLLPIWPSFTSVIIEGDIVKHEPSTVDSTPPLADIERTDDIIIVEPGDKLSISRLHGVCRAAGNIDTLFADDPFIKWYPDGRNWRNMQSAEADRSVPPARMEEKVKQAAHERGANVAQLLYASFEWAHSLAPSLRFDAYLHVRYWSCPVHSSSGRE